MTTTRDTDRRCTIRSRRSTVDPYCVEPTTWTREELLAVRGMTPMTTRRRPASKSGPKAA